jgi:hypothetical protein
VVGWEATPELVSQDRERVGKAFGLYRPGYEHRQILRSAQWGLAAMPAPISFVPGGCVVVTEQSFEICPGCKLSLPIFDGPTHDYIGASPSCWALFGQVMAREYGGPAYMKVHQLTVDAYAVQHPGRAEPRAVRSVWGHLASLYLQLEQGVPTDRAKQVIPLVTSQSESLGWIEPPEQCSAMTIADVVAAASPAEHCSVVEQWARSVWNCWSSHHRRIAAIADEARARMRTE